MAEDVQRQGGGGVTLGDAAVDLAHVVGAAQAEQAAAAVQKVVQGRDVHAQVIGQIEVDGGIQVAATRAHHQALQGRQAHGGVDALAAAHRRGAGAIAQVQGDQVAILGVLAQQGGGAAADIGMGGAVKAIAPHPVGPVQVLWQGIAVGRRGHGLVEGGIEDRHLGHPGEEIQGDLDARQIGRIVQGRQGDHVADDGHHRRVNPGRPVEGLPPMHHPMTHGGQIPLPRQHPGGVQLGNDVLQTRTVIGDGLVEGEALRFPTRITPAAGELAPRLADTVHRPRRQDPPVGGVEELIFDG